MKKFLLFLLYICFFHSSTDAANELYVNGATVNRPLNSPEFFDSTCLVFINGDIYINQGNLINSAGTLEITGNFTNIPNTIYTPSDSNQNGYKSTGTEKFYGNKQQFINGTMNFMSRNSAGFYKNQFYNLKVYKGDTTGSNKYLTLNTNVHVANSLSFDIAVPNAAYAGLGTNGAVIRTDSSSPDDVNLYTNYIYLENPSVNALANYAPLTGNGNRQYIEGKLKRQVNSMNTYDFPVGLRPYLKDGMEGFSLTFNSVPANTGILGYIRNASANLISRNVLCDIGKDPYPGTHTFNSCAGGRDNVYDLYYLDIDGTHEWVATPDAGSFNFNITLFPGFQLDNILYLDVPLTCDPLYLNKRIRVVAGNGVVGGTSQVGLGHWAPFGALSSYIWCTFEDASSQITLSNQTSFSTFRIHGSSLQSSFPILPVELVNFSIRDVNNSYFDLIWSTASELENAGFELERSLDGIHFEDIAWISGNGTTNIQHMYQYSDKNVSAGIDYYYRLKQTDYNTTFKYSNILSGKLKTSNLFEVSKPYPNPINAESYINITTAEQGLAFITMYTILGQTIRSEQITLSKGENKVLLQAGELAAGTYLIEVTFNDIITTNQLIKY